MKKPLEQLLEEIYKTHWVELAPFKPTNDKTGLWRCSARGGHSWGKHLKVLGTSPKDACIKMIKLIKTK